MGNLLSSGNNTPDKLFGVKLNSSDLGKPVTVVMGCVKTNQQFFWIDGFSSQDASGGKGAGKGTGTLYSADVVAGLSAGTITGIGDVWTGQSWLGSPIANETYTITSPYSYTPTNATSMVNNYGVTPSSTYAATYSDYSAPGTTSVSNTTSTPYIQVPYGSSLTSGEYMVDPATGQYFFASANAGATVSLAYSYLLTTINNQENDIVPAGRLISVGGSYTFEADLGVTYGGTGANAGNALTKVSNLPSVTGTYAVRGSAPATYHFASGDVGAEVTITFQIQNTGAVGQGESTMLDFTLATGSIGQTPYSYLTAKYPGAALGYSGIATVLYEPMDLGSAGSPQENSFEVITPDIFGGVYASGSPILDCNPVQCITNVLTNTQWGLGVGALPFPTAFIDNGSGGTWGSPGTPSTQSVGSTAWNWFTANSFFISPVLDSQDSADAAMSKWLEAGMCASYVSEGLLKLVPYGDTTLAGNGCTWTAPSTYVVALDDTCFVAKNGTDPIAIKRSAWQDAYNSVQVQWQNRNNQYAPEITQESDQSLINRYGSRIEDPQNWEFIHTLTAATFAADMRLKRGTYIRNTYDFTLPFIYSYLEPMDLVTLTTSSVWAAGTNNTNLGVSNLPVRITKIVDDPVEGIKVTAEDYPFGAGQPTLFNKGESAAEVVVNTMESPGTSEVVMFEASGRLVGFGGNQIWMGACGTGAAYGSTNVWVSQDGTNYVQIATLDTPSTVGTLASSFASGSDPDTVNSLVVQIAENCPALPSGTTTAADNDTMLAYVDGEVVSYSACACTGQNTYTMGSYIRRGQMGTTIGSHASGSLFLYLDSSIYKYTYDPTWEGKTLYFKFQAVNTFGNNPQPLSNLTAVTMTLTSGNSGTIDASTGLVDLAAVDGLPGTLTTIETNVTAVTTTVTNSQSPDYLTNNDKIALMQQYNAELATQTHLDSTAASLSVSSTLYDNAVAAIGTTLIAAGAPSNWATTYPDGTVLHSVGIKTSLASDWETIAAQRTVLQFLISAAQAAAAESAAIASAVATATANAPSVVSSLPSLPSSAYPSGKMVWNTSTSQLYLSSGSAWTTLALPATDISGTLTSAQIASVAASTVTGTLTASQIASLAATQLTGVVGSGNLCVNSDFLSITSGVPTGFSVYNNGSASITSSVAAGGAIGNANYWHIVANTTISNTFGFFFNSASTSFGGWVANTNYIVSFYARMSSNPSSCSMLDAWNHAPATVKWQQNPVLTSSWQRYVVLINFGTNTIDPEGYFTVNPFSVPSSTTLDFSCLQVEQGDAPSGWSAPPISSSNPLTPANAGTYIGSGTISTSAIAANAVTASQIAAGTITATQIAASTITGTQIAAGTIAASNLVSNTITASQIASNTITATQIAAGTITTSQIAAGTIAASNIASNTITASQIAASTITGTQIAANTITAGNIVANTITAGQIAAGAIGATQIASGAITANMITTGTLNAATVSVINLNASNISTGTLSATKVLFPDGSALSTASRVITSSASLASATTVGSLGATSTWWAIPGVGFSTSAASTADVYNIYPFGTGWNNTSYTYTLDFAIFVDGVQYSPTWSYDGVPFLTWVTGLSAGSHTIQAYVNSNYGGNTLPAGTGLYCQRFY